MHNIICKGSLYRRVYVMLNTLNANGERDNRAELNELLHLDACIANFESIRLDELESMTDAELDGVEQFETDGFDITGQAISPDYRPDSEFEFATNQ